MAEPIAERSTNMKGESKYGFQYASVGDEMRIPTIETELGARANAIRSAAAAWCKRHAPERRFSVRTVKSDGGLPPHLLVMRLPDEGGERPSTAKFEETALDVRGNSHRKYNFGKLHTVGMSIIVPTSSAKRDRVSAHVAGKQWARLRELDWKFKVRMHRDEKHIIIERVK